MYLSTYYILAIYVVSVIATCTLYACTVVMCMTLCQLKISIPCAADACFTYSYDGSVDLDGFLCHNCTSSIGSRYFTTIKITLEKCTSCNY